MSEGQLRAGPFEVRAAAPTPRMEYQSLALQFQATSPSVVTSPFAQVLSVAVTLCLYYPLCLPALRGRGPTYPLIAWLENRFREIKGPA